MKFKIDKPFIIKGIQSCLNQYKDTPWFTKRKCKYKKLYAEESWHDFGTVELHYGIDKSGDRVAITFEGSSSDKDFDEKGRPMDWFGKKGNINFGLISDKKMVKITDKVQTKIKVHAGIKEAARECKDHIKKVIEDFGEIDIFGHSRGGMLCEYMAENIGFYNHTHKKTRWVAVAPSRVGNNYFVQSLRQHTDYGVVIYLGDDPVPRQPSPIFGHRHPDNIIMLSSSRILQHILTFSWLTRYIGLGDHEEHYPDNILREAKKQL